MKLVILTNILTPYRLPLFHSLQQRVADFSVLLMAEQEENRQWILGNTLFRSYILPGIHVRPKGFDVSLHFNYGVIRRLYQLCPDVVISAGFGPANLAAFAYCKLFGKKYIGWAHLTLRDGAQPSPIKRHLRRWIISNSDGSIGESTEARHAFLHYGAKPHRILIATMPLDVSHIHEQTAQFRKTSEYQALRRKYSGVNLLSIGQIVDRKGYKELLDIYEQVAMARSDVSLIIVGDGPDRKDYERYVQEQHWTNVHFVGYVQTSQLHKYLALSDIFVFHTLYDPFGIVLSEAMAAELPVISSVHAASTQDLIEDGITGFRIDPKETASSAAIVLKVLQMSIDHRQRIGRAGYDRVKRCDIESSTESIIKFVDSIYHSASR